MNISKDEDLRRQFAAVCTKAKRAIFTELSKQCRKRGLEPGLGVRKRGKGERRLEEGGVQSESDDHVEYPVVIVRPAKPVAPSKGAALVIEMHRPTGTQDDAEVTIRGTSKSWRWPGLDSAEVAREIIEEAKRRF